MKQLLAFLFSLMLVPLSFGQNVGEAIESPDMKRFLQSHTLDLEKDFVGWITESNERRIKYGDWSCVYRNQAPWCTGYWDQITIKSNPFELMNKAGEVPSVMLKSEIRDPRIPSDVPKVQAAKMETKFISPYLDLSLNNNDKLEFEYRVSSVDFFSFLVILSDEEGGKCYMSSTRLETPVSRIHQLSMKKPPLFWMVNLRDVPLVRFYPLDNLVKQ